jgi:outer membrane biosynthesis protein TonB
MEGKTKEELDEIIKKANQLIKQLEKSEKKVAKPKKAKKPVKKVAKPKKTVKAYVIPKKDAKEIPGKKSIRDLVKLAKANDVPYIENNKRLNKPELLKVLYNANVINKETYDVNTNDIPKLTYAQKLKQKGYKSVSLLSINDLIKLDYEDSKISSVKDNFEKLLDPNIVNNLTKKEKIDLIKDMRNNFITYSNI